MNKRKGFTLIELIVSILIFSIAMSGIVMFTASNNRRIIRSERRARLSVHGEKAFEAFRGLIMQETGTENQMVFDSIWETKSAGDTVYQIADTVKNMIIKSLITIEEFEFKQDSPVASGSRIRFLLITKDNFGGSVDSTFVTISRHR